MKAVLRATGRTLLSLSDLELITLSNALNEVCNGVHIGEVDFQTRVGVARAEAISVLAKMTAVIDAPAVAFDVAEAWADSGVVMVRAVSVFGDPVELGEAGARQFAQKLTEAIRDAS